MPSTVCDFNSTKLVKELPLACMKICNLNSEYTISKMIVQPGWGWSKCIKPIVKTDLCMAIHVGVLHSGILGVKMENGDEFKLQKDNAYVIEPGHDAWVIGDEPVIGYEFNAETSEKFGNSS